MSMKKKRIREKAQEINKDAETYDVTHMETP